mmetsp:Transcript_5758/g.10028  ORF Transcript_5758/g.10028 Transcript_5758/m.10028 type:complete len:260 (+) Transcript_5758:846-1625(+)
MFMRSIVSNVAFNHVATCSWNVSSINDVQNDIGTIHDFEEFSPDSFRLSFEEQIVLLLIPPVDVFAFCSFQIGVSTPWNDSFAVVSSLVRLVTGLCHGQKFRVGVGLFVSIELLYDFGASPLCLVFGFVWIFVGACQHELIQLDSLPPCLASKRLFKGLLLQQGLTGRSFSLGGFSEQSHGQLFPLQDDRVRVCHLLGHFLSKGVELFRIDDPRIAKPTTIGSDPSCLGGDLPIARSIFHHKVSTDDPSLLVADGFCVV